MATMFVVVAIGTMARTTSLRQAPGLECLSSDSLAQHGGKLVYGNFQTDRVTRDVVGMEITLRPGRRWTGTMRMAHGEPGAPQPLLDVTFSRSTRALAFRYLNGPADVDTASFVGTMTCDSIFGVGRPFRHVEVRRTFRRLR